MIDVIWSISVGDLVVGVGTLALAVATGLLARHARREVDVSRTNLDLTRDSIEALDRPFLIASPDIFDYTPTKDLDTGIVSSAELALFVDLQNLGRGPAILDGASLTNEDGREMVSGSWSVESAFTAGEERSFGIGMGDVAYPVEGERLLLRLYYRSASATRYETSHHIRVGRQARATRLDFKRTTLTHDE